ncbi:putative AMP deaminase-like [Cocos nucifera]|uniref:Putative AMP deaminase-like n=1 Tax=Cocos nucifera TaxID=13894 RepID=A0A8K0IYX9_COCNU|nr:putative AMP deaminase-like [Cocos nucifera]
MDAYALHLAMAALVGASFVAVSAYYLHWQTLSQLLEFTRSVERERAAAGGGDEDGGVEMDGETYRRASLRRGQQKHHRQKGAGYYRRCGGSASSPDVILAAEVDGEKEEEEEEAVAAAAEDDHRSLPRLHMVSEGNKQSVHVSSNKRAGHIRPALPRSPVASASAFESVEVSDEEDNLCSDSKLDNTYMHTDGHIEPACKSIYHPVPIQIADNGDSKPLAAASMIRSHSASGNLHGIQPDPVAAYILKREPEQETFVRLKITPSGHFLAELTKQVFSDLAASKYQMAEYRISIYGRKQSEWDQLASWIVNNELYSENVVWLIQMAEYRISIYGRKQSEWDQLASWIVNNELYSENVVWLIQIPRLYNVYKEMGIVTSFQNILDNIFLPLFEVTVDPESHPQLHVFLKQVVGLDLVDDETKPERCPTKHMPTPAQWTNVFNPAFSYYVYYCYANLYTLNKLRESKGMTTIKFRPHAGEAGDIDHLAAAFLVAHNIAHGTNLRKSPVLQYLYYLAQLLKLSSCDLCEIARNSVLQSGFSHARKSHWIGRSYYKRGPDGNDVHKTNVPHIRVEFRDMIWREEMQQVYLGKADLPEEVEK